MTPRERLLAVYRGQVPDQVRVLDGQIEAWLALRRRSPALIIAPGDQVPPDGRIERVCRLVEAAARATY